MPTFPCLGFLSAIRNTNNNCKPHLSRDSIPIGLVLSAAYAAII